jgi:leucyl-tRNA---protein transferase
MHAVFAVSQFPPQVCMFEILVYDQHSPCPYLPGNVARMPLRKPMNFTAADFDRCLAVGDRRLGYFLYHTQCPNCHACEPIRLPVTTFAPNRSQRRAWRKGNDLLEVRVAPPVCDERRLRLYNRHKHLRHLDHGEPGIDADGYREFLIDSCCRTWEFSYWYQQELVAVAISDQGATALNAVYCYYEPEFAPLALGTYNVLTQIEYCRRQSLDWLYLGFYISDCSHMVYKGNYVPHERLQNGNWIRFDG